MTRGFISLSLFLLASPLAAASFLVTSTADSGPGTLRQAILDANHGVCAKPCTIDFGLQAEGSERRRIELTSPLPPVKADEVRILADMGQGDLYIGHLLVDVVGFAAGPGDGIRIEGARDVRVAGISFIGFRGDGLVADRADGLRVEVCGFERNERNGIHLADTLGASVRGSLIASNGHSGIFALRSAALHIDSNAIGTDTWNTDRGSVIGNALNGIHLHDTRDSWVSFNFLHNNSGYAILVTGISAMNDLEFNDFAHHRGRPIEIGGDAGDPSAPVIESATVNRGHVRVRGTVRTEPATPVRLQFYSGGRLVLFEREFRSDENGVARFEVFMGTYALESGVVSAIATHLLNRPGDPGQTSEFSAAASIAPDDVTVRVTTAADSGPGSLRDAIEQTNRDEQCGTEYPCGIEFDVAGPIQPLTPLPAMTRAAVLLDGRVGGTRVEIKGSLCSDCNGLEIRAADRNAMQIVVRNIDIRNFARDGILVDEAPDRRVYALVGDCSVTQNGGSGVHVARGILGIGRVFDNQVDLPEMQGCVLGGNGKHGLEIGEGAFVWAARNWIGTDGTGVVPFANRGSGIFSRGGGDFTGNIVAFNHEHGIAIERPDVTNAVLGGEIHSNWKSGIELSEDHRPALGAPLIATARVEGEQTHVTYSFDGPPVATPLVYVITIYASSFAEGSGEGEGRVSVWGGYVWEPGSYEVTIPRNLAGKYLTATATKFDAFYFGPAGTTSEFSDAVQVTAGSCPTTEPSDLTVDGTAFQWTAVPGATEYRIWLMKKGDEPRIGYLGAAPEATLSLAPGEYDWVVEARFGPGCYGTQSDHGLIRIE